MKFSIVTNAFNQGRFLRRCMESVLQQNYHSFEYIVIDPGSTDGTDAILREYEARGDRRLTILREPDKGPADGLNKGFGQATGEWFGYVNADDFYLSGALQASAKKISAEPMADCIYGDGYITNADGVPKRRVFSTKFSARRAIFGNALVLQQSTFYRATSFRAVGGFNIENRTSWDYELLIDMDLAGMKLLHSSEFWSAFAIHDDSITGSQRHAIESNRNHERIFQKIVGRPRTLTDIRTKKLMTLLSRFSHPGHSIARIIDEKHPRWLPQITAGLPLVDAH